MKQTIGFIFIGILYIVLFYIVPAVATRSFKETLKITAISHSIVGACVSAIAFIIWCFS